MDNVIASYNEQQSLEDQAICNLLAETIDAELTDAEHKIWHAHPVWFLDGNPIVGYSKQKSGLRLMFWSGADFEEEAEKAISASNYTAELDSLEKEVAAP